MEKSILLILTFTVITCSSQNQMSGNYCYGFNDGDGNCIDFLDSNRFNWESTGDMGTYYVGSGRYSFEDEKLILRFDRNIEGNPPNLNIESFPADSDNEVDLRFRILDNHKQSLPGVRVTVRQDSLLIFQSDINGYLEINSLLKESKPVKIELSNLLGYQNLEFELIPDSDKEINLVLYPQQPEIISDQTIQFKILSYSQDTLYLMNSSGQRQKFAKQQTGTD